MQPRILSARYILSSGFAHTVDWQETCVCETLFPFSRDSGIMYPMRHLLIISALLLSSPVAAQTAADTQAREEALKAREAAERRVEADMVKMKNLVDAMARNLGQLHYLRTLCFGSEDQKWRDLASKMMTMESGDDPARRRQLVGAFNAGYYLQEKRFDVCTKDVSVDAAALAENGRHIASMLGDPYRER